MNVDVLNMEGKKVDAVELPAEIFEAPVNVDLMHQAYVRQLANARLGTHSTKTRSEVLANRGVKRAPVVPARVLSGQPNGLAVVKSTRPNLVIIARRCLARCVRLLYALRFQPRPLKNPS